MAISVPDLEAACNWYEEIFGFKRIRSDRMTIRAEDPEGAMFKIYDGKLQKVNIAWLSAGNGVAFEVFQFIDPPFVKPNEFDYTRGGFFHIAITVPDPDAMAARVCEKGGKQIGKTVEMYDGERALYVQDPWGNIVECLSCSFEKLMANRA